MSHPSRHAPFCASAGNTGTDAPPGPFWNVAGVQHLRMAESGELLQRRFHCGSTMQHVSWRGLLHEITVACQSSVLPFLRVRLNLQCALTTNVELTPLPRRHFWSVSA